MKVRDYRPDDFEAVKALHEASEIDYRMPELGRVPRPTDRTPEEHKGSPLFLVKKVAEVDGRVVACCALRIECETYLFCGGGPVEKMDAMRALQPAVLEAAWMSGIDNVVAWIPEDVEAKFAKRLQQLGWSRDRDGWHSWSRATSAESEAA